MKRLMQIAALAPLAVLGAQAQDVRLEAKKKLDDTIVRMNMVGAVKGPVVKGKPYSADEITETNQVLADGTRIHRETKVTVYRDSEGRTRREAPDSVTISDPVSGSTYVINSKTNTVRKMQMSNNFIYRSTGDSAGDGAATTFSLSTTGDGQANIEINGKALDPKAVSEMIAKAKAEGSAQAKATLMAPPLGTYSYSYSTSTGQKIATLQPKGESLGTKNLEGLIAEGTRNVETIETGAVGNDRPFQVANERWYSEELDTMVYTRHSDPRTGEEIFRLTNIRRGDPPAYLFDAPAEAHPGERKM